MSLKRLNKEYDRVIITHNRSEDTPSTRVVLIKGLRIHIGIANCAPNDNFNRKLGRIIASGRAEFASQLNSGEKQKRASHDSKKQPMSYTIVCNDVGDLDNHILGFLPKREENIAE